MAFESRLSRTRSCHCFAARKRARALTRLYDEALRPHGLRATQFSVLAVLALKGPTTLGELADVLELEPSSLSRNANVMVKNGWLEEAESTDRRERLLQLTGKGRDALEATLPAWESVQDGIDAELEGPLAHTRSS